MYGQCLRTIETWTKKIQLNISECSQKENICSMSQLQDVDGCGCRVMVKMLCMCLGLIVKQCELCFGFLHSLRPLWPVAKVCPYSKLPLQLHYRQCRYLAIRQFIPAFQGSSIQTDKENSVLIINQFTLNKCFSVGEFAADLAKMTASHLCHKCPGFRESRGAQPKIFLVCREFAKIGLCLRLKSGSAPVLRSSVVI